MSAAVSQSTSTAIELPSATETAQGPSQYRSTTESLFTSSEDEILRASLQADSEVPEGGYGWVIVFSCAMLTWWAVGTSYCWGVLQAALVKEGLSSPSTLSFVGSVTVACISFLAIVNARIIRALGARITAIIGVAFLGLGGILSGFAVANVGGLFATSGVVSGIGTSLLFMVVSTVPAQYFKSKRGIANGIVYAGGGLGGAVISFLVNSLLQSLGPAWTFRVLGSMTLITALPAAYLIKERTPIRSTQLIEWRLFRDVRFLFLFVAGAVGTFPLFVPPFFLPLYSNSLGLSSSVGASLVAAFNFSSALGRLLSGFCSDRMGPLNTLFMALLLSALSMLVLWPISDSLGPLVIFVIINGMANGGFFSTIPTVVGNVFGSARVSIAMGMIVTGWAGGYLMGAPIAGYILDASGGQNKGIEAYHPAIFYAGSMSLSSAGLVAFVRVKTDSNLRKRL